jgi:hypothetical protein
MSVNVRFNFDLGQFNKIMEIVAPERARLAVTALLSGTRYVVLRNAILEAPFRTGNLRRSGQTDIDKGALVAHVGFGGSTLRDASHSDYATIVEGGARPHAIFPSLAIALRFIPGGGGGQLNLGQRLTGTAKQGWDSLYIYRSYVVQHPGVAPNPFLDRGYQRSESDMNDLMRRIAVRFMRAEQQNDEEENPG